MMIIPPTLMVSVVCLASVSVCFGSVSVCAKPVSRKHEVMQSVKNLFILLVLKCVYNLIAKPANNKRSSSSVVLMLVFFSTVRVTFRKNPRNLFFLPGWSTSIGSFDSLDVVEVYNASDVLGVT